jgi:integrase
MSRRRGQNGSVFQKQSPWSSTAPSYGRFWVDAPDGRKRETVSLGICATRTVAKRKLREHIDAQGVNSAVVFRTATAPGTTFREQSEFWLSKLAVRKRRPVKPATLAGYRHSLSRWVLPTLGERPLAEVSNGAMRELIEVMTKAGLSAKSIVNHAAVVRLVVASAVSVDGEELHPRKWNNEFCGLPIVNKARQRRPTVTETELNGITAGVTYRFAVLFSLMAGTGLRIGEALALKPLDFAPDFRSVYVTRSVWHGNEQDPKTPAAVREVDIAEPLASLLRAYAAHKVPDEFLFATKSGKPIAQRNALRAAGVGLHAFRRFRAEMLRRVGVPQDIERGWLGHAKTTVGDLYAAGLDNDRVRRREWCDKVGLGFPILVPMKEEAYVC